MTDEHVHAADAHHVGGGHDHDHDEGHMDAEADDHGETLGPIDWKAWGATLLGIGFAALIGFALVLPTLE